MHTPQGYRKQDAYIVTQIPFESNRTQFWKMIETGNVSLILLLMDANTDDLIVSIVTLFLRIINNVSSSVLAHERRSKVGLW